MTGHNSTFKSLLKEAEFTKEMLGAGATQIRLANYSKKGIYFQSFTSLATGLERIGKLCIMLNFYIDSGGQFPSFGHLKKDIGHDLTALYRRSQEIAAAKGVDFSFLPDLSSDIHQRILRIISDFAQGDRYSNIDLLVGGKKMGDPIATWAHEVDTLLYELRVPAKKKKLIEQNARDVERMLSNHTVIWHLAEDGSEIRDIRSGSLRAGMYEAVAPYRQLSVLQIIRYWVELLSHLGSNAMALGRQEIPHFLELFGWFYTEDAMLRTKKIWNV